MQICFGCVLIQAYTYIIGGKDKITLHPVIYMGALLRGIQHNWAAFAKEANVIYMSIKRLSLYLDDIDIF